MNAIASTEIYLIARCLCNTGHNSGFSGIQSHIDACNQLCHSVHCQIDVRPPNHGAAVQAGDQVDIGQSSVHLVAAQPITPAWSTAKGQPVIPLIGRQAFTGNSFLRSPMKFMVVEVVAECVIARRILFDLSCIIRIAFQNHHFIGSSQGKLTRGIVVFLNCLFKLRIPTAFSWFISQDYS